MMQASKTKRFSTAPEEGILPKVCAITLPQDPHLVENVSIALQCGIRWIQYRQKDKSRRYLYDEARVLHDLTRKYNALLTINDYVDIAMAIGADGVHIGQEDLPLKEVKKILPAGMIVGVSTHSIDEALSAETDEADYIGFGPVFKTTTKDAGVPKGIELAQEVARQIKIPVIAIGGITARDVGALLGRYIHGLALSSGIFRSDIKGNCERVLAEMARLQQCSKDLH